MVAPVGQEQVAVLVEVADVADGHPAVLVARRRGFRRVVEVLEGKPALEVDLARLPRRQLVAILVEMCTPPSMGLPTEPGCASQSSAVISVDPIASEEA